jgi:hypothetical protein
LRKAAAVETNPYQTSELAEPAPGASGWRGAILALLAVTCWLLSAVWAVIAVVALFHPAAAGVLRQYPYLFSAIVGGTFVSPVGSLVLFGLASWRRSVRLTVYGLILLIPTVMLYGARLYFGPF